MHIAVIGAGGFIGRHIVADLAAHGHRVTAVVRTPVAPGTLPAKIRRLSHAAQLDPDAWAPLLAGVEIIVNAAGVLRGRDMDHAHVAMPRALHAAATSAGVSRVVLLSAISARADVPTDYAEAKLSGEALLRESGLGWTILRPSLVYADGSYGGTSVVRGLAAMPLAVPLPGDGRFDFSPIHARDLARAVRVICEQPRFSGSVVDPAGPVTLDLRTLLARYRQWLGFGPAAFVSVPLPMVRALGRIGDLFGDGPVSSNSLDQMVAGNAADGAAFAAAIGFRPRSLDDALRDTPAQVQDRWHARLFWLAPAITAILAFLWLASGLLGLFRGQAATASLVEALGLPAGWADPLRIGSSTVDLALAAALIAGARPRLVTPAQLLLIAGYTLVIGWAQPQLWLDPLGALLKNLPILLLVLVHGAIAEKR